MFRLRIIALLSMLGVLMATGCTASGVTAAPSTVSVSVTETARLTETAVSTPYVEATTTATVPAVFLTITTPTVTVSAPQDAAWPNWAACTEGDPQEARLFSTGYVVWCDNGILEGHEDSVGDFRLRDHCCAGGRGGGIAGENDHVEVIIWWPDVTTEVSINSVSYPATAFWTSGG